MLANIAAYILQATKAPALCNLNRRSLTKEYNLSLYLVSTHIPLHTHNALIRCRGASSVHTHTSVYRVCRKLSLSQLHSARFYTLAVCFVLALQLYPCILVRIAAYTHNPCLSEQAKLRACFHWHS